MIRKELTNKKVVRAVALGLSSVMLTTPITAMAGIDVTTPEGGKDTDNDSKEAAIVDVEQKIALTENYSQADAAIDNAQERTDDALTEINDFNLNGDIGVRDEKGNLENITLTETNQKITSTKNDKVGNDTGKVEVTTGGSNVNVTIPSYDAADFDTIGDAVCGVVNDLKEAEMALGAASNAEGMAKDLVDNTIEPAIEEINTKNVEIVAATQKADEAAKTAGKAAKATSEAQTEEEAQAAIADAKAAWNTAKEAQETAATKVEENKKALEDVEKKVTQAEFALAAAKATAGTSAEELEEAVAALTKAEEDAKAIAAELAASEAKLTAAEGELAATKEQCLLLAYNKMKTSAEGHITKVYEKANETDLFGKEGATGTYWNDSLEYFKLYIQYMYDEEENVRYEWFKVSDGHAEEKNTYRVIFEDADGNEVTKDFNYHVVDADGNIAIYEKTWNVDDKVPDGTTEVPVLAETDVVKVGDEWVPYDAATHGDLYTDSNNKSYIKVGDAEQEDVEGISGTVSAKNEVMDEAELVTTEDGQKVLKVPVKATVTTEGKYIATEYKGDTRTIVCDTLYGQQFTSEEFAMNMLKQKLVCLNLVNTNIWENVVIKSDNGNGKDNGKGTQFVDGNEGIHVKIIKYGFAHYGYEIKFTGNAKRFEWQDASSSTQTVAYNYYATSAYETEGTQIGTKEETKYKTVGWWTESLNTSDAVSKDKLDTFIKGIKAKVEGLFEDVLAKKAQAAEAQEAIRLAKEAALAAKNALMNVVKDMEATETEVANAREAYLEAKEEYDSAVEEAKAIDQEVDDAEEAYNAAQDELNRFAPVFSPGVEGGSGSGDADDNDKTPVVIPVATPDVLVDAPVAPVVSVAVVTPAAAAPIVVDIDDEAIPLAGGIGDGDGNGDAEGGEGEVLVAGAEEVEPAIVAIEDEETPLAAGAGADAKMSWWWLLIIALLGATGYKMYKNYQKKKEEAAQEA